MAKRKKERYNVVYSTNPDYDYSYEQENNEINIEPDQQSLFVSIDRKQRGGKEVTVIEGFIGSSEELKTLAKHLKSSCGVGGTAKDSIILVQGNFKDKVFDLLVEKGYSVKKKGGY